MVYKDFAHLVIIFMLFLLVFSVIIFAPRLIEKNQAKKQIKQALENKDSSFCEKIFSDKYKKQCYYELALTTKNEIYCKKSNDNEKCLSQINQN